MYEDTDEQKAILARVADGADIAIVGRPGAAKTSTNLRIAETNPKKKILYVGFTKRVVEHAETVMPKNVRCRTAHKLAMNAVGYMYRARLAPTPWALRAAITERFNAAYERMDGDAQWQRLGAVAAMQAVDAFCASVDERLEVSHVPEGPYDRELIASISRGLWRAMIDVSDDVPVNHDVYLKLWQLALAGAHGYVVGKDRPIAADIVAFDEGQDASPCMLDIVLRSSAQLVISGDPRQAIYGWRHAVDAFGRVNCETLPLTLSWRFGPEIAAPANDLLRALGENHLIDGRGQPGRVVVGADDDMPHAIISRTNAGLVNEAVDVIDKYGATVYFIGGHEQLVRRLQAAWELWRFNATRYTEFSMFNSWETFKRAASQPVGKAYSPFVHLIDKYGVDTPAVVRLIENHAAPLEDAAEVVMGTPHAMKGQEYDTVELGRDFVPFCKVNPTVNGAAWTLDEEEAHVLHVALTRAKKQLDLGGCAAVLRESLTNVAAMRKDERAAA